MNKIGESGTITDSKSLYKGKMCVVVGETKGMYIVKLLDNGQTVKAMVNKKGIDFVEEEYATGGTLPDSLIQNAIDSLESISEPNDRVKQALESLYTLRDEIMTDRMYQKYLSERYYGKGGRMKFKDKVEAISSRLEGKKVASKYRKQYGATYDKEEANMAAKRIAGSMLKRERYAHGGVLNNYIVVFQYDDDGGETIISKSKPIPAEDENEAAIILQDEFESLEGIECYILYVKKV